MLCGRIFLKVSVDPAFSEEKLTANEAKFTIHPVKCTFSEASERNETNRYLFLISNYLCLTSSPEYGFSAGISNVSLISNYVCLTELYHGGTCALTICPYTQYYIEYWEG